MIRVRQIKIEVKKDTFDYLQKKVLAKLKITFKDLKDMIIVKKSIDARDKNNVLYVYEVNVELFDEEKVLNKNKSNDVVEIEEETYKELKQGRVLLKERPIIVGEGPAGLF